MADYLFFLSFLFVGSLESFPGDDLFVFPNNTSQAEEIGWVWGKTNLWARWNFLLLYISGFLGVDSEAAEKILPVTVSANTNPTRLCLQPEGPTCEFVAVQGQEGILGSRLKASFFLFSSLRSLSLLSRCFLPTTLGQVTDSEALGEEGKKWSHSSKRQAHETGSM